jgi:hypothetical protein
MKAVIVRMLRTHSVAGRERVIVSRTDVRFMTSLAAKVFRNELQRAKLLPTDDEPAVELGRRKRYPFESLSIGENFFVPCTTDRREQLLNSLTSCRNWQQRKSRRTGREKKFVLRSSNLGVRCWRVA